MTREEKKRLKELRARKKKRVLSDEERQEYITLLYKRSDDLDRSTDKIAKIGIVSAVLAVIGQIVAMTLAFVNYFK